LVHLRDYARKLLKEHAKERRGGREGGTFYPATIWLSELQGQKKTASRREEGGKKKARAIPNSFTPKEGKKEERPQGYGLFPNLHVRQGKKKRL